MGTIVKGYNYLGWTANELLGGLNIKFGLKNVETYRVKVHALPGDYLDNSMTEYFYPDRVLEEGPYQGDPT